MVPTVGTNVWLVSLTQRCLVGLKNLDMTLCVLLRIIFNNLSCMLFRLAEQSPCPRSLNMDFYGNLEFFEKVQCCTIHSPLAHFDLLYMEKNKNLYVMF